MTYKDKLKQTLFRDPRTNTSLQLKRANRPFEYARPRILPTNVRRYHYRCTWLQSLTCTVGGAPLS